MTDIARRRRPPASRLESRVEDSQTMTAPSPPSDPQLDSPVLRPLGYGPTAVSRPQSPWGLALGIVAIIILGMVVYASLSQAREAAQRPPTPPPALAAGTASPSPTASMPAIAVADSGAMQQGLPSPEGLPEGPLTPQTDTAAQEATTRLRAPAMVVDLDSRPAPDGDVRVAATIGAEPAPTRAAPRPLADDSKIDLHVDRADHCRRRDR